MVGRVRYASDYDSSGYAVAAMRCAQAMRDAGIDLVWEPLVNVPGHRGRGTRVPAGATQFGRPLPLAATQCDPSPGETLIIHSMPRGVWTSVRTELPTERMIGHLVWEADVLPAAWLPDLAAADELWVPTEWNAATFRTATGRPVHVVPHVTAPFLDEPLDGTAALPEIPDDHTVFLTVSAWDWRKRPDRTIDAYLRAFDADDPVTLVVKTDERIAAWSFPSSGGGNRPNEVWRHAMDVVKRYPRPAAIVLDTAPWTHETMHWALQRADCYISLTSGEGWGLGAFDAACVATPVLITGHGGPREWLGADYPGLIPFRLEVVGDSHGTTFEAQMHWACPDIDWAVDAMRAVHGRRFTELAAAATAAAPQLRERYSPAAVGAIAARALA